MSVLIDAHRIWAAHAAQGRTYRCLGCGEMLWSNDFTPNRHVVEDCLAHLRNRIEELENRLSSVEMREE